MGKLTPLGRLIIILAILGAIFAGLKFSGVLDSLSAKKSDGEQIEQQAENEEKAEDGNSSTDSNSQTVSQASSFSYTPPAPVGGTLKGVVELGASGFNSFIINVDDAKNWKLEKAEFGNSLAIENMASDADITAGLKKYIGSKLDYGVAGKNIHFVVSSGAMKAENTQKIIKALKTLKYNVNTVTAEQEGQLALKCVLPKEYEDKAFVVDIGSGNTKITWKEAEKITSLESYGAKYFQNGTDDKTVATEIASFAKKVPDAKRKTCFIIGGSPSKLAKQVRKGEERYTVLEAPEFYKGEDAKDKAGINIYKALADATGCDTFVFDWDANFTIGFLLDLSK
ncbi:MAG: hypothetical protein EAZ08_08415 [Cytophagales bacterium]|nr:MAG: hypothetical protein EAZ08_08415 [Cytophagales bacterium]